jgi:cysteine desulfurase
MVYFDHNATAPMMPEARQAWLQAVEQFIGNPSSPHRLGARAAAALTEARHKLAALLACDPLDLVWTSGATESNNTLLHHFAHAPGPETQVWVSAIEHPSLLQAAQHYFPKRLRLIPVSRDGVLALDWLAAALARTRPALVAVMAANNETGVLQPWREALALCRQYEVPFCCDAVQWLGRLPAQGLGACDFVSGCAHKCGGPRGIGFLKGPAKRDRLLPLLRGGPQEDRRRPGTENVPAALALAAALAAREQALAADRAQPPLAWRQRFETRLAQALPGSVILGQGRPRLWNTVSALMPDSSAPPRWVVKLDKLGFAVSTGSACSTGQEKPSHVLTAMGFQPGEASRMLRFSSGWETRPEDWEALLQALLKASAA